MYYDKKHSNNIPHHTGRRYEDHRRGDKRRQKGFKGKFVPKEKALSRRQRPTPIGVKCNPLCPFFFCTQRALVIINKPYRGKYQKVAFCRLTGSECIGAECRYASCRINALLPDGRCSKALEKRQRIRSDEELFREIEKIEDIDEESLM